MKKFLASSMFIVVFASYALFQQFSSNAAPVVAVQNTATPTKSTTIAVAKKVAPAPKKPTTVVVAPAGKYRNGTYTGSLADAYYGNVQVRVTITNGKIADVAFLNYPQDRGTSRSINSYAMPQLTQEAISAQSAQVNGVSGASDTSAAFRQSLASALSQAA